MDKELLKQLFKTVLALLFGLGTVGWLIWLAS